VMSTATLAVHCRGLRKQFGPVAAVDGVDLDVTAGEIFGLLGPNGAGKTTAIRVLTTLLPPDGGEVTVFGRDVTTEPFAVRRLIGYVPQQLSADGSLTGRENVGLFARLFDVPRRQRAARTDEVLAVVGLAGTADRLASTYSGGMIRRLEPYLDYLTPGVLAQSTLFVAVFYGIQVIWERDVGVLAKLLVTPTPRSAVVAGKGFAAGIRAIVQVVVVIVLALLLGVQLRLAPWLLLGAAAVAVVGAAFFATLSMTIAGLVLSRERLMGIGQAITMPLFFASNALYPISAMPVWIRWFSYVNPLSYEVDALRGLLIGTHAHLWLDAAVLSGSLVVGVVVAAAVLPRLVR
jgi:ABC-2 type transport system permease protein